MVMIKYNSDGVLEWGKGLKRSSGRPLNAFILNDQLHLFASAGKNLKAKSDGRLDLKIGSFQGASLYHFYFANTGRMYYEKVQDYHGGFIYNTAEGKLLENERRTED